MDEIMELLGAYLPEWFWPAVAVALPLAAVGDLVLYLGGGLLLWRWWRRRVDRVRGSEVDLRHEDETEPE